MTAEQPRAPEHGRESRWPVVGSVAGVVSALLALAAFLLGFFDGPAGPAGPGGSRGSGGGEAVGASVGGAAQSPAPIAAPDSLPATASFENAALHVVDLYGGGKEAGNGVFAWWSDNDTVNQEWRLIPHGDAYVLAAGAHPSMVAAYDREARAVVLGTRDDEDPARLWLLKESPAHPGFLTIRSKTDDHCVTDADFTRDRDPMWGRRLSVEFCADEPTGAQLWFPGDLVPGPCSAGTALESALGAVCRES